jgi:hypothetical protein
MSRNFTIGSAPVASEPRIESKEKVLTTTVSASSRGITASSKPVVEQKVAFFEQKDDGKDDEEMDDYESMVQDMYETTIKFKDFPNILSLTDQEMVKLVKTGAKLIQSHPTLCCCKSSLHSKQLMAAIALLSFAATEDKEFAFESCGDNISGEEQVED